jgi:hypothetical protein
MKTVRLTEAGLNKLVKRIIEDKGSEGLFMDYHSDSKASTGKEGMVKMQKIMDKLERMKSRFESSNFSFSKDDVLKLELIDGLLAGKNFDTLIDTYKEKNGKKENSIVGGKMNTNSFIKKLTNKQPFTKDDLHINGSLDLRDINITSLPEGLQVEGSLDLSYSKITSLPKNLYVGGTLILYGCKQLRKLPEGLDVEGNLNLEKSNVSKLPENLRVHGGIYVEDSPLENYSDNELKAMVKSGGIDQIFF